MSSLETATRAAARAVFHDAPSPAAQSTRRLAAWCLVGASAALARVAAHLLRAAAPPEPQPLHLEFHAEAGATGGALFLDGRLVAWIPGVTRL